jgi:hypothetical protein
MVERLQPYRRVMGSQPFWALRELERLSNQDKHRLLQVAVMSAAAADMYIEREPRACEIKDIAFRAFIQRPLDEGQEIMAVNLRNIGSDPEVYVKTNTAPYIGFSDGEDCVDLLRRVQGAVERAVMTFEPEFQNPQSVKTLDRVLRRHRRRPARTQNVGMLVRDREGRRLHRIWQAPERPQ